MTHASLVTSRKIHPGCPGADSKKTQFTVKTHGSIKVMFFGKIYAQVTDGGAVLE